MVKVIGVRFKDAGKVYSFDPGQAQFDFGDHVIVETVRGVEYGEVVIAEKEIDEKDVVAPLKKIIRKATDADWDTVLANREKEKSAFTTCIEKIKKHDLDMKLVDVEYTFDAKKIIFYFTADGRVDFRELVKDLASVFRTRIELRQIGVRDQAKFLGGIGPCGRECCCSSFLGEFHPVSIKMAKDQNLSLSPTKISGLCGRLMCCLNYEHEHYQYMKEKMPPIGTRVKTPDASGTVVENNPITEKVKVKTELPDGSFDLTEYPLSDIKFKPFKPRRKRNETDEKLDDEIKKLLDE
ncbi:MAG: stage 0 sporulation family protein [Eubacteriales bacterium]